jgi:hypothetical protein
VPAGFRREDEGGVGGPGGGPGFEVPPGLNASPLFGHGFGSRTSGMTRCLHG